jgi:hypothetical protein
MMGRASVRARGRRPEGGLARRARQGHESTQKKGSFLGSSPFSVLVKKMVWDMWLRVRELLSHSYNDPEHLPITLSAMMY